MPSTVLGEVIMFGGDFAPQGWAFCDGQQLAIASNNALHALLGTRFGGDGINTFALPDLRGRVAVHPGTAPGLQPVTDGESGGSNTNILNASNLPGHTHEVPCSSERGSSASPANNYPAVSSEDNYSATSNASMGSLLTETNSTFNTPINNMQPFLSVRFIIALENGAAEPFIGEMVMFAGNVAPQGWAFCDGQPLAIAQNSSLYSLLGSTYGGNGHTTFHLPDMRGRVAVHPGAAPGLQPIVEGQSGGSNTNVLGANNLPGHTHGVDIPSSSARGRSTSPVGNFLAASSEDNYSATSNATMGPLSNANAPTPVDAVNNMQPFQGVRFIIALQGVFPSHN